MFKNNLKIAWRNMLKDPQFTLLNLLGLSAGLACTLLIYFWINKELHVDKFNRKDSQLYEVMTNSAYGGQVHTGDATPGVLGAALKKEMPEVEQATTVFVYLKEGILMKSDKSLKVRQKYAGEDYFSMFTYPLVAGDAKKLLTDKNAVVISEATAMKLFRTTDNIVGKTLQYNDVEHGIDLSGVFVITGIFKSPPADATEQFDVVFNYALLEQKRPELDEWFNGGGTTYLVLRKGTDVGQFNRKIRGFLQSKNKDISWYTFVRPYSDKYLYDKYENGVQAGGRIEYVRMFSIIAVIILVIACINFMNLSTARAAGRLKEVGIKKTLGAERKALIFQYLVETLLMTLFAFLLAIVIIWIFLPKFISATGNDLVLHVDVNLVLSCLGVVLITGLLAGSYPAFYISGFKPSLILKGKLKNSIGEIWTRKGLVVFQFTISTILIVSVLVVYRQMSFIEDRNLGYSRDNILMFKKEGTLDKSYDAFITGAKQLPGVVNASNTWGNMSSGDNYTFVDWPGKSPNSQQVFGDLQVNYDFVETMGIKMKEGRSFSRSSGDNDTTKVIFNEVAIDVMGLKDPIGKTVTFWDKKYQIIGVVKNFFFESAYEKLKPCFLILMPMADNMMIKIRAGHEKEAIAGIQHLYEQFNPGIPFEFRFLDEDYQKLYASERKVVSLSEYFGVLAIAISCLGLFGLAAFTARRRQKEISIRKVVGASISSIVLMLSKDFLQLVLISVLIAFPVAWWITHRWLNDFAYHIAIGYDVFLIAGSAILLVTLITISFQTVKAAWENPVGNLRTE